MEYLEQELDINSQKIKNLEKEIALLHDTIYNLTLSLKETQRYLIKMAQSQSDLTKRVSQWPFIAVPDKQGDQS
jgi:predicted  nucleic acid-binding Zn-ribbon protein